MNELQELTQTDLVPYERGIPPTNVLRATLGRFLPGSFLGLGILVAMLGLPGNGTLADFVATSLRLVAPLLLGYGLGLESLRRWLYPDAEIEGRRSFIAGLMSSVAIAIPLALVPAFWASAIACRASVVLPEDSGP